MNVANSHSVSLCVSNMVYIIMFLETGESLLYGLRGKLTDSDPRFPHV